MSRSGGKPPSLPEDAALWHEVARTVAPLGPRPEITPKAARPEAGAEEPPRKSARPVPPALPGPADKRRAPTPPALSPLDKRTRGRLARGVTGIDGRIDLHGLTQAAAHRRLLTFLAKAQADGARLVLVITGKGRPAETPYGEDDRGILKRMTPVWLAAPDLRGIVVGFEAAARAHGGEGALYVRIRRRKPD